MKTPLALLALAFLTVGSLDAGPKASVEVPDAPLLGSCSGVMTLDPVCNFSCTSGNTINAGGSGVGLVSGSCGGGAGFCAVVLGNPCPDGTKATSSGSGTCLGIGVGTYTCSG